MDEESFGGGRRFGRRRSCRFCGDKDIGIDFKDPALLRYFITEHSKIVPRRISGNCAKHQRKVGKAVKQARCMALLPYVSERM